MQHSRFSSVALITACLFVALGPAQPALATGYNNQDYGNCNNWYPFGESYTQWSAQSPNSTGSVHGQLQWENLSELKWYTQQDRSATVNYQSDGDADVQNPENQYEYGTGPWQEQGWHWATFFPGVVYQYQHISCGP